MTKTTHIAIYMLILAALSAMITGCHDTGKWNGIEFANTQGSVKLKTREMKAVDTTESMFEEEEMMFDVEVNMDFMEPKNEFDTLACNEINKYIITKLLDAPETATHKEAVEMYIERTKKEFKNNDFQVACTDHLRGKAEYGREGVINYTLVEDYFGGGAHPTQVVVVNCFNSDNGRKIGLWDIFVDSCSNSLKNLLTERLMQKVGVDNMDDLHELGYLEMTDIFISENFWLKNDSIIFFYNQYDIAPYAAGQTELGFTYEELGKFMR